MGFARTATVAFALALTFAGCARGGGGGRRSLDQEAAARQDKAAVARRQTEARERAAELAAAQRQATSRFQEALATVRTVKAGDSYADFYRKVDEARLVLERVTTAPDGGRVERYSFADNPPASVTVRGSGGRIAHRGRGGVARTSYQGNPPAVVAYYGR